MSTRDDFYFVESCPWCDGRMICIDDNVFCQTVGCGYFFSFEEPTEDESDIIGSDDTEDDPDPSHRNPNDCSWFEISNGVC